MPRSWMGRGGLVTTKGSEVQDVRRVLCLNGHDATGVEGFECPACQAELRTVLVGPAEHRRSIRPRTLVLAGGLIFTLVLLTLAVAPVGQGAFLGGVLISFSAVGAALWVGACLLIASAIGRSPEPEQSWPRQVRSPE